MRIYNSIVIDIASGTVLDASTVEYSGPLAFASGGGSSGSSNTGPAVYKQRIPEEQGAFDIWSGLSEQMIQDMGYGITKTDAYDALNPLQGQIDQFKEQLGGYDQQIAALQSQLSSVPKSERAAIQSQITSLNEQKSGVQGQLDTVQDDYDTQRAELKRQITNEEIPRTAISLNKLPLTPEQQAQQDWENNLLQSSQQALTEGVNGGIPTAVQQQLDTIYDAEDQEGRQRFMQLGTEMAGSRGMNVSDTPIGAPLLREYANFQTQLRAAKAGDLLSERRKEIAQAQAFREFHNNMQQQRQFSNPLGFMASATNMALGTYQPRFRGGVTGQQQVAGTTAAGIGSIAGGLGSLAGTNVGGGQTLGGAIWNGVGNFFGGGGGGWSFPSG